MKSKMKAKLLLSLLSISLFCCGCSSELDSDPLQTQLDQDYISYTLDLDAEEDSRSLVSLKKEFNSSFGQSDDDYFSFTVSGLGTVGTKPDVEVFINKKGTDGTWINVYRKRQQWKVVGDRQLKYDGKIEIAKGAISENDELELVAVLGGYSEKTDQHLLFYPKHNSLPDFSISHGIELIDLVLESSSSIYNIDIPFILKVGLIRSGEKNTTLKPLVTSPRFIPQGVLLTYMQSLDYKYIGFSVVNEKGGNKLEALAINYRGDTSVYIKPNEGRIVGQNLNPGSSPETGLAVLWLPKFAKTDLHDARGYRVVNRGRVYAIIPTRRS